MHNTRHTHIRKSLVVGKAKQGFICLCVSLLLTLILWEFTTYIGTINTPNDGFQNMLFKGWTKNTKRFNKKWLLPTNCDTPNSFSVTAVLKMNCDFTREGGDGWLCVHNHFLEIWYRETSCRKDGMLIYPCSLNLIGYMHVHVRLRVQIIGKQIERYSERKRERPPPHTQSENSLKLC